MSISCLTSGVPHFLSLSRGPLKVTLQHRGCKRAGLDAPAVEVPVLEMPADTLEEET